MHDGDHFPIGESIAHVKVTEALEKALEVSGYRAAKRKNVGRGCAVGNWVSKGGESYAFIKIDESGQVTLSTAVTDTGPGAYTVMRQIVSQELDVPLDSIRMEIVDTTRVLKDTGVRGSSSTRVHGGSAFEAGTKTRHEILRIAAHAMGASPDELLLNNGGVTHGRAERRMSFGQIAAANGGPIIVEGHYANPKEGPETSTVAQIAEVEVNRKTGRIWVKRLVIAHDCGLVINPEALTRTVENGALHSVSRALYEEVKFDTEKVTTVDWASGPSLRHDDVPEKIDVVLVNGDPNPDRPDLQHYGAGETVCKPMLAAVANAVFDATGERIRRVPLKIGGRAAL